MDFSILIVVVSFYIASALVFRKRAVERFLRIVHDHLNVGHHVVEDAQVAVKNSRCLLRKARNWSSNLSNLKVSNGLTLCLRHNHRRLSSRAWLSLYFLLGLYASSNSLVCLFKIVLRDVSKLFNLSLDSNIKSKVSVFCGLTSLRQLSYFFCAVKNDKRLGRHVLTKRSALADTCAHNSTVVVKD